MRAGESPTDLGQLLAARVTQALRRGLSLPPVAQTLDALLRRPRALMLLSAALGIALTAGALAPVVAPPAPTRSQAPDAATSVPSSAEEQEALAVIAAYNQASISAGVLGRAELLAPYLAPDGAAWRQVQAEYARRARRGETQDAALVRWGVLRATLTGDAAVIVTQEEWDVITSVGPAVISSRRGVLVRNEYTLRRAADGLWQIVSIATTPVIS